MADTTPASFSPIIASQSIQTVSNVSCAEFEHLYQPIGTPYGSVKADTAWHCMICGAMLGHVAEVSERIVEVQQGL